jgi:hypothetical protein
MRAEFQRFKRKCPLDEKPCEIGFYDDMNVNRSCRHGSWNNNAENPKCGLDLERKKKSTKPKSKRVTKKRKHITK